MFEDLFPINWEAFHFLRPKFLWLIIPIIIIFIIQIVSIRQKIAWKKIIAPHLRKYMISKGSNRKVLGINVLALLILTLGILSIAGPTWKKKEIPGQVLQTPFTILLELSESMEATDIQPSRVERAVFKINDLIEKNPEARMALVGFAGTAHTIVPLTADYNIIKNHIDGLNSKVMPLPGSNLQNGLALADSIMAVTQAPGTLLLLADELQESQIQQLQDFASNTDNKIEVLPVMATSIDTSLTSFKKLKGYEKITINNLTLDNSDVDLIAKRIRKNLEFTENPEEQKDAWRDAGLILVILMAFLFLFCFRKGWSLSLVLFLFLNSCSDSNQFKDLWYTADYQAQKLSDKGDYLEAAETFENPLRKGIAYFKAENYDSAIRYFNEDTTAISKYNLGLAYYKNGDLISAQLAFQQAIEKDSNFQKAQDFNNDLQKIMSSGQDLDPNDATESENPNGANNKQNNSMEDLSGGGQEASEEDMEKERREETAVTDIRKVKELDEVPDDIGEDDMPRQDNTKVLMQKIDDDPTLFLKRKFRYQVKKQNLKSDDNE